ncbi:hypothetical protein C8Q73DRAFT_244034 [Cubamyces lactineus]|nr:hypothetical protein C8Q73DRAFT_244034 [Cubamyces lactineus]
MPRPDPPFPSFTTMSIQSQRSDLRLPSYREGFVIRYHPYPRAEKRVQDPDLMVSVLQVSSLISLPHKALGNMKHHRPSLQAQHGRLPRPKKWLTKQHLLYIALSVVSKRGSRSCAQKWLSHLPPGERIAICG